MYAAWVSTEARLARLQRSTASLAMRFPVALPHSITPLSAAWVLPGDFSRI